jgi:hypothetical protein
MKKNKINKENSGKKTKKIIKKEKKPCGEHCINPWYLKKKYKAKFSINYILKKIKSTKTILKKKWKKKAKK